jgi:type I restriction enzyme S subunit
MDKQLLSTLFNFQKKSKIKAGDGLNLEDGNYPFYTSSDTLTKSLNDYLFEDESLIFGTGGKASVHFCDSKFAVSTDCFVCQPKSKTDTYTKFVFYYLSGNIHLLEEGFKGAGLKHISKDYLSNIEIPLPPLDTQKKIAAILDEADKLRQLDKKLIEKYDALTQSLFLDMFGDPVTNPKGWEKSKAENHIDLLTGYAFKSKDYSEGSDHINLCGGLIIMPWGIEWDKCNKWNPEKVQGLNKYWLEEGDIVMAMDRPWISSGFKICMLTNDDIPSLLVQRTARIRSNSISSFFLYNLYNSLAFERHAKPTETTVPHISPKDIRSFEIITPPLELQNQFAERVQSIESQKAQAQHSLQKSEELFNSLLQKAFKGELV